MRPWLLLPILLPALWAGATYTDMWSTLEAPLLARPEVAIVAMVVGLVAAWGMDQLSGRRTGTVGAGSRRDRRLARKALRVAEAEVEAETEAAEPADRLISWDGTPMPAFTDTVRQLKVEMPEPRIRPRARPGTAPPAPRL